MLMKLTPGFERERGGGGGKQDRVLVSKQKMTQNTNSENIFVENSFKTEELQFDLFSELGDHLNMTSHPKGVSDFVTTSLVL